jgi:uncharacterized protein YyaL (SSP411 family)
LQLLEHIAGLWRERKMEIAASADELHARLELITARDARENSPLTLQMLRHALENFKEAYDPANGGFGVAPKFPQPGIPSFVLRAAKRFGDDAAIKMVLHTCDKMAAGGIRDQLGGGFARYAVDAEWLVPHFEKMLYDNAQLAQLYLDAFLVSGDAHHAEVARDILDYVLRDMTHPDGGFYSAEDADSEAQEGKFYCWTKNELSRLLTVDEFNVAVKYFGITAEGNFVDHSHPQPLAGLNVLSVVSPGLPATDQLLLVSAKRKMSGARAKRIRPHLDDKILTSWNGLMLGVFARASIVLGEEKYRAAAEKNVNFIKEKLWQPLHGRTGSPLPADGAHGVTRPTSTLFHRWRDGERDSVQLLEAYAFLLSGVVDLYEVTLESKHLDFAIELAGAMLAKFYDAENGGFWQSAAGSKDLILRVKDDYDGAEPSGNSVATLALLKLGAITGQKQFAVAAEKTLRLFAHRLQNFSQALPFMLQAVDFQLEESRRVVIAGDANSTKFHELLHAAHSVYQPNKIILGNTGAVEEFARTMPAKSSPVVYLCTGQTCQPPTGDAVKLKAILE